MPAVITGVFVILKLGPRAGRQFRIGPERFRLRTLQRAAQVLSTKMFADPERNFVRQTVLQDVTVADDLLRRPMWPAWRVLRLAEKTETFDDCFLLRSVAGLGLLKSSEVSDADLFRGGGAADQQKRRDGNGEQRGGEMSSSLIILCCHVQSS